MLTIEPIRWLGDRLELLDQRQLPAEENYLACTDAVQVADAIRNMVVRGAPAIGIAAAYGMALAAKSITTPIAQSHWCNALDSALDCLAASRPTAINLFWALNQARGIIAAGIDVPASLERLAVKIHRDDILANRRLGDFGAALLNTDSKVYTHCNAGALATGGYGTALGVIRSAHRLGKIALVYAGETRPWWQGARLTTWELMHDNIPVTLCTDSAAGTLLKQQHIDWVIVGADRVAANGDVANKIGTYNLAVLARYHGARFMVAVPTSTFDLTLKSGDEIPIEERAPEEITHLRGMALAPADCAATNPAFDVTPAALIDVLVTEYGLIEKPDHSRIAEHFKKVRSTP